MAVSKGLIPALKHCCEDSMRLGIPLSKQVDRCQFMPDCDNLDMLLTKLRMLLLFDVDLPKKILSFAKFPLIAVNTGEQVHRPERVIVVRA